MKTTAGKPTFKGTKASKDFFKDETKIEAPGKLPCRDTLYELQLTDFKVMARPYAQVAKSGTTSGFTNTLVQAAEPFPNMATGSKIRAQPLAPSSQPGSYAGVTKAPAPPKSTGSLAGWNANVKIVSPGQSKTSTSPPRPVSLPRQPIAATSAKSAPLAEQQSLRVPRYTKTTAASIKKASPKSSTTFKFVANAPSPKASVKSYAPPLETKTTTATGPVADVKGTPPNPAGTVVPQTAVMPPNEFKKTTAAIRISDDKAPEDPSTVVRKTSTKNEVAITQSVVKLPEPARAKSHQKKNSKVVKPPALPLPSVVENKPVNKKAEVKQVTKKVETKPVGKKVDTKPVTKKGDDSAATAVDTAVPATLQKMTFDEDSSQNPLVNDPVVAASAEQEQGMSPSSYTSEPSDHVSSDLTIADGEADAPLVPKKKKRSQKSGAQRKKEARGRALAERSVNAQVAVEALSVPATDTQSPDPGLAVQFVATQILTINTMARIDALGYTLNHSIRRLGMMAQAVPSIKESRRNLEEALRTVLTALFMQGILMNVREETYDLSDQYMAQNGEDIMEQDEARLEKVANHEVKAFRNVCCNLEVHARAAKALEEVKAEPIAPLFHGQDMQSISNFQFSVPGAFPVPDAGALPAGQPVSFMPPPPASNFSFSMPSGSPSLGSGTAAVEQPEFKKSPFVFGGSAVAAANKLKLSPQLPDTDASESDDAIFHSEDSDSSATEDEPREPTIEEKKEEPCWALIKYHGSLLSATTVMALPFSNQQSTDSTEDESEAGTVQHRKDESCMALTKYHGSLLSAATVAVPLLGEAQIFPATEDAAESAVAFGQTALVRLSFTGALFSVAVKLAAPLQPLLPETLSTKLDFSHRIPPQALQVLDLQGSYSIPPVLKFEASATEDASAQQVEDLAPPPIGYAAASSVEDGAIPSVDYNKAMVLSKKPRRVPRAPSTPEQRGQRGPYRLNYLIGISPLREFLMELADPYARTYTKAELIEAFITLSSRERLELDIGFPHAWTAAGVLNNKRLANRIVLGSIRLSEYLDEIAFDEDSIAMKSDVLGAWQDLAAQDEAFFALEDAEKNT
jgi:hypothetical protein